MNLQDARERIQSADKIAVLTGSGVSAASGIATFRGQGGLWRNFRAQDLATPQAYARDPQIVWEWYAMRFHKVMSAEPNPAHDLLVRLETQTPTFTLVTQNVDGLHERAGSENVRELHGNLTKSCCERCGNLDALPLDFPIPPRCSSCGSRARPNVVWFGETLPAEPFQSAISAFERAEVALVDRHLSCRRARRKFGASGGAKRRVRYRSQPGGDAAEPSGAPVRQGGRGDGADAATRGPLNERPSLTTLIILLAR